MSGLLLASWLTLGWLPNGAVVAYDPPAYLSVNGSYLMELGVEATWGPVFAGGSMLVPVWQTGEGLDFWPTQLISTTDIGITVGPIRLGWQHTCGHIVTPYLSFYDDQLVPGWDSFYDMIYLRIEGGRKR